MKFLISRTSVRSNDEAPCEGCRQERFTRVDTRTARPKDIPAYKGRSEDWWYSEGENHRELKGPGGGFAGIARDFPGRSVGWFRDFATLEELIDFQDRHGTVLLTRSSENPDVRELEICDDYRD